MSIKRSPFVHKVSGARNVLLVDLLQGSLFHIDPQSGGDPQEMEKQLTGNGLAVESRGIIPQRYHLALPYKKELIVRQLQLRITRRCHFDCPSCGTTCCCFRGPGSGSGSSSSSSDHHDMSAQSVQETGRQLQDIHIETVVITGGNPLLRMDIIEAVREGIKAAQYRVFLNQGPVIDDAVRAKLAAMGMTFIQASRLHDNFSVDEGSMQVSPFDFFYRQDFNPCWGNQIAIDTDGTIKPCLWAQETAGNIHTHHLKDLFFADRFDPYWNLAKSKLDTCSGCEYRFSCTDCRVETQKATGNLLAKTSYCNYNPQTGLWEK